MWAIFYKRAGNSGPYNSNQFTITLPSKIKRIIIFNNTRNQALLHIMKIFHTYKGVLISPLRYSLGRRSLVHASCHSNTDLCPALPFLACWLNSDRHRFVELSGWRQVWLLRYGDSSKAGSFCLLTGEEPLEKSHRASTNLPKQKKTKKKTVTEIW